jgi:hypothetical protein
MRLDGPLRVGARGGHGPIRYEVVAHEPSRLVRFRFAKSSGIDGEHAFEAIPVGDGQTLLRHTMIGDARGSVALKWRLAIRRLHDALLEDALDKAAKAPQRPHPLPVRLTRRVIGLLLP